MYLVELAAEGVAGFPRRIRLSFKSRLNVVRLASSDARRTLIDVFFHTLFPDPDRADVTRAWADPAAPQKRALLTLAGRDKVPYRIYRDLESGRSRLFRFDDATKKHKVVSEDGREAHQFLRVQHGLPDDASYELLFLFASDGRPSLGDAASLRAGPPDARGQPILPSGPGLMPRGPMTGRPGLGAPMVPPLGASSASEVGRSELTGVFPVPAAIGQETGVYPALGMGLNNALVQQELKDSQTSDLLPKSTDDDLLEQHRDLVQKLQLKKRLDKAERTLDALSDKELQAEEALREAKGAKEALAAVEAAIDRVKVLHNQPPGLRDQVAHFEELEAKLGSERQRLEDEIADERRLLAEAGSKKKPRADPLLLTGAAAGGLSAIGAVLLGWPWLALGQAVGGVVAGLSFLRSIADEEAASLRETRIEALEGRAQRLERQHLADTAAVRSILAKLGLESARDLEPLFEELDRNVAQRARLQAELEGAVGRRGRRAQEVISRIADHRKACEDLLTRHAADSRDLEGLERRLEGVEAELESRGLAVPEDGETGPMHVVKGTADLPPAGGSAPLRGPSVIGSLDDDDPSDGYEEGYPEVIGRSPEEGSGSPPGRADGASSVGALLAASRFPGLSGPSRTGTYGSEGAMRPDRSLRLAETAADLAGQEVDVLIESIRPRLAQFMKLVTSGRFRSARFESRRGLVVDGPSGERCHAELEGALLDQADAALRFALLETVLPVRRVPVVIEEPYASLPQEQRELSRRIYAHFAGLTQVIVLTPAGDLEGHTVSVA